MVGDQKAKQNRLEPRKEQTSITRKEDKNHGYHAGRLTSQNDAERSGRGDPESLPLCATVKLDLAEQEASFSGSALAVFPSLRVVAAHENHKTEIAPHYFFRVARKIPEWKLH
jgi:hypothetical protein